MKNKKLLISILTLLVLAGIQYITRSSDELQASQPASTEFPAQPEPVQSSGSDDAITTVPKGTDYSLPALRKGSGEQILHRTAMTISYNKEMRIPNWVAYQLLVDDMDGYAGREPEFYQDMEVDEECRVSTFDYSRSGYDRGHMAPAADFSGDSNAKKETFYMTNICPQNHELNGRYWNNLEQQCRRWAYQEGGIYSVVGPIVTSKHPKTIGKHQVVVPDAFFRCVVSLRKGQEKAIGFIYKNISDPQQMSQTACTVDQVEEITGLDLFAALPQPLQDRLEGSYSLREWNK